MRSIKSISVIYIAVLHILQNFKESSMLKFSDRERSLDLRKVRQIKEK
jgi:hypothetical protein